MKNFKGTGVALVTPFAHGKVDFEALRRLIDHVAQPEGVDYVVSLGSTGEAATLSSAEQLQILEFTTQHVAGRVGIVAGFGGNNTHKLQEDIKAFHFEGVDGILSASPAYNKPTQEGIYQHYMALAEVAPRPIILYNVPGRTASNMTAETTLRLAAHGSSVFAGIKEASANLGQMTTIARLKPEGFDLISGDDALALPIVSIGAVGLISVAANAYPVEIAAMMRASLQHNFAEAQRLNFMLQEIIDLMFVEGNPAGVKGILHLLGVCSPDVRLPLVSLTAKTMEIIKMKHEELKTVATAL
jgi:4-hydroxy-tetrahydrodipicolinate synthase